MNPNASIYTAEALAIDLAPDLIDNSDKTSFLVLSDSLSCLKALNGSDLSNSKILHLRQRIHHLKLKNKNITLAWIPSHIGIEGNESADALAKETLNQQAIDITKIPHTDIKPKIYTHILSQWNNTWKSNIHNKLFQIKPSITPRKPLTLSRRDSVIYTRLKIGHSYITHKYLLQKDKEDPPFCEGCDTTFTIKHILIDCIDFSDTRVKYYKCSNLKTLFDIIEPKNIINFIKEINLYNKI